MSLISIFTAPKPFDNPHIATIQRNAILSWLHLGPEVEVLLVGDEIGIAEVAAEYNIRHLPEVARNEKGTPLVSSIFKLGREASQSPLLAYINADIMLLPDFVRAAKQIARQLEHFLVIGRRWDLDLRSAWDFSPGWDERLTAALKERGRLHPPAGSDYFLYPRPLFEKMPDFAIGRAGWDNWMIYQANRMGWAVIDGTPSITVIHQDHDYSHLPGGKPHYDLDESQHNMALAGGAAHMYMTLDAGMELRDNRVRPARWTPVRTIRRFEQWAMPDDGRLTGLRGVVTRKLRRLRKRIS